MTTMSRAKHDNDGRRKLLSGGGYTGASAAPTPEEIERQTRCQCERPNRVREFVGRSVMSGTEIYATICIKCGRTAR